MCLIDMPANIYVIGAHCTGKTSLVRILQKFFLSNLEGSLPSPAVIDEVAREVMKEGGYSAREADTQRWQDLQLGILKAQCAAEEALTSNWFISDRSALDPIVYATVQGGTLAADVLRKSGLWEAGRKRMRAGTVILCRAGNRAWLSADDVRMKTSFEEWKDLDRLFQLSLDREQIPYHVLDETITDMHKRLEFVLDKMERGVEC